MKMAPTTYNLTQDELHQAELMSFRIMMAIFLSRVFQQSPDPAKAASDINREFSQIAGQIQLEQIPKNRRAEFQIAVLDRGSRMVSQAANIKRTALN
jgi:hypothetical protein